MKQGMIKLRKKTKSYQTKIKLQSTQGRVELNKYLVRRRNARNKQEKEILRKKK